MPAGFAWKSASDSKVLILGSGATGRSVTSASAPAETITITTQARSITQVAPEVFIFTANVDAAGFDAAAPTGGLIRDPRKHELYYRWSCSQADTFTKVPELDSAYRDAAKGYSFFWIPTIRTPGTHTISVDVWGKVSGVWTMASGSTQVTVGDPDTYFSGTDTIFMSASGSFGNAPSGATQVTSSSIDTIISSHILNSGSDPTPKRLMVNRGESYIYAGNSMGNNDARRVPTLHYVAGGDAGERPIVTVTGAMAWDDEFTDGTGEDKDFVMQGLDLRGPWDSTTSSGGTPNGMNLEDKSPSMFCFDDCLMDGFNMAAYITGVATYRHGSVNDCDISNWKDYGIQAGNYEGFAITGSRVMQDPLAECGPTNVHNPLRQGVGDKFYCYGSRFFSRNGWSDSSDNTYRAIQPCLRLNQSGLEGAEYGICGNIFEGGAACVAFSLQGGPYTNSVVNAVIEKNIHLMGMQGNKAIELRSTGITIRNNLFLQHDGDAFTNLEGKIFVSIGEDRPATGMLDEKIEIYNNHGINLKSDSHYRGDNVANFNMIGSVGNFTDVTEENNLVHEPNYSSGATISNLQSTGMQFTPVGVGYIDEGGVNDHPEEATPTHKVPYTGSGGFTPGSTLNATGGKTATVVDDMGTYVYVYDLSEAIADGDSLTETPSGGTGTCNGGSADAGTTATYAPLSGSSALAAATTGLIAFDDFYSNQRETIWDGDGRAAAAIGCYEPDLA